MFVLLKGVPGTHNDGLFYVDQVETLQGSMEARLAVSPIYLSSIGSLPFCFLFIHYYFGVLYDLYDWKLLES